MSSIGLKYEEIRNSIPQDVTLVAATKGRTVEEILQAVEAGVDVVGENYVQEAVSKYSEIGDRIRWHMIGHLQRNKVRDALKVFESIQSVDSLRLAAEIDKRCRQLGKIMPVLIEINSGREEQKAGVLPEGAERLISEISGLQNIKVMGMMTMGPFSGNPEDARPYFVETKRIFDQIKGLHLDNVEMKYLSMGMTNSYRIALEEGANIVRIGTGILFSYRWD